MTTHASPRMQQGLTPCCRKTVFELPNTDRMTVFEENVDCSVSARQYTEAGPVGGYTMSWRCPDCPGKNIVNRVQHDIWHGGPGPLSGAVTREQLDEAYPHGDACCTKGCPGWGFCAKGAEDPANCDRACSCEQVFFVAALKRLGATVVS